MGLAQTGDPRWGGSSILLENGWRNGREENLLICKPIIRRNVSPSEASHGYSGGLAPMKEPPSPTSSRSEGPFSKSSYFLGDPPPDPRILASLGSLSLIVLDHCFVVGLFLFRQRGPRMSPVELHHLLVGSSDLSDRLIDQLRARFDMPSLPS
jgi:hypothetical protein